MNESVNARIAGYRVTTSARIIFLYFNSYSKPYNRPSDRVRKKMENYAEIFGNIMRKKVRIMRKRRQIMRKFLKLI